MGWEVEWSKWNTRILWLVTFDEVSFDSIDVDLLTAACDVCLQLAPSHWIFLFGRGSGEWPAKTEKNGFQLAIVVDVNGALEHFCDQIPV